MLLTIRFVALRIGAFRLFVPISFCHIKANVNPMPMFILFPDKVKTENPHNSFIMIDHDARQGMRSYLKL